MSNVIHNWYELVRSVAANIDCHEYLPFDFVAELASEIFIEPVLIKKGFDVLPTLYLL